MSNQTEKTYTKDYIDGVLQGLRTAEIYLQDGGTLTKDNIETERKHYSSLNTVEPSKRDLSKIEVSQKSAEVRELNSHLSSANKFAKELKISLDALFKYNGLGL